VSAAAISARVRPVSRSRVPAVLIARAGVFFAFAAFAAVEYSSLLLHPPVVRAVLIAAIATATGALLAASDVVGAPPRAAMAMRVLILAAALIGAVAAAGVPVHLLVPRHWGTLTRDLHGGFRGLSAGLWPYIGPSLWARTTVLVVLAPSLTVAAALYFWPSRAGAAERRVAALAILLALVVAGAANAPAGAWRVQGLLLLALIAALLWQPSIRGSAGARVGGWLLACAVPALVAAPLLAGGEGWFARSSATGAPQSTTFQWDQLYGPITWSRSRASMFVLSDPHPGLLRVTSLDRFDGLRFLRSSAPPGNPALDIPRANPAVSGGIWDQYATVAVTGLRSELLVNAGGVSESLTGLGTPQSARRSADGTLSATSTPAPGDRYRLVSYDPTPLPRELRRAPASVPGEYRPYVTFELPGATATALTRPDLGADASAPLPPQALVGVPASGAATPAGRLLDERMASSPYGPMFALARGLASGQRSSYDVVRRMIGFLRARYAYDEHPPQRRFPLEAFLFTDRRGYCQQFSGAMTLMLRMDGIPARVGVGFIPTVFDALRSAWIVRAFDAHAWVEVFFTGIGWVAFDPTPPAVEGSLSPSLVSKAALLRGSARSTAPGTARQRRAAAPSTAQRAGSGAVLRAILAALAALAAAVLLLTWVRGARRLRRLIDGDHGAAVAELRDALGRTGRAVEPSTTLASIETQLGAARAAGSYVRALRDALYAPGSALAARDARTSARARADVRRALAAGGGVSLAVRAFLALPPGVSRRAR